MYEMYPDTWHVTDERHDDTAKPRRRARKEHPVAPVVHPDLAARTTRRPA